jgi:tetratricopeptide (TPR) repeat protein
MRLNYLLLFFCCWSIASAQQYRSALKQGNKAYRDADFSVAQRQYQEALELKANSFESQFNLGNSYYQQEDWEKAAQAFALSETMTNDIKLKAQALHNLGNAKIQQQEFQEAADAYKRSLRLNPDDKETRYNLAQALRYLKNPPPQENQGEGDPDDDSNENDEEKNNDKNDSGDGDNKDDKSDEQKQDNDGEGEESKENQRDEPNDGKENEGQGQPEQPEDRNVIPQQEAARLLDALDREEQKLQEKLRLNEQKGKGKQTEKKW